MKSIYYLRIPKTGSVYFMRNLYSSLSSHLLENNVEILNSADHEGWEPIKNDSYVISILRDPVKRTVGHFCHQTLKTNSVEEFLLQTKNNFLSWYENNQEYISDFQSKNILCEDSKNLIGLGWMDTANPYFTSPINSDILKEKIKSINILIKTSDLNLNLLKNVSVKIQEDLGVDFKNVSPDTITGYSLDSFSTNIYNSLSESEKNTIYDNNPNDTDIYFNSNYFRG